MIMHLVLQGTNRLRLNPYFSPSNIAITQSNENVFVHAEDEDSNDNGRITYSIVENNAQNSTLISINAQTGRFGFENKLQWFCLGQLSIQEKSPAFNSLQIKIRAADHGKPPRHADQTTMIDYKSEIGKKWKYFQNLSYVVQIDVNSSNVNSVIHKFMKHHENGMLSFKPKVLFKMATLCIEYFRKMPIPQFPSTAMVKCRYESYNKIWRKCIL
jgi:hypothetical protein